MKILFDTNVYVAEALLGAGAEQMVSVTRQLKWRIFTSRYVLDEVERVLAEKLQFTRRFAVLTRIRVRRRATLVDVPASRHTVPGDPADSPVLAAALAAGADLLVTNDPHLLALNPYEGLRILSMTDYFQMLVDAGHIAI